MQARTHVSLDAFSIWGECFLRIAPHPRTWSHANAFANLVWLVEVRGLYTLPLIIHSSVRYVVVAAAVEVGECHGCIALWPIDLDAKGA